MRAIPLLFICILSFTLQAKSLDFHSAKEIAHWNINQKTDLYLSYVQFFLRQEKEDIWKNIDTDNRVVFLDQLKSLLLDSAEAKLEGEFCFFGGWKSQIANHSYCKRPWNSHPKNYKNSTCEEYEFQCNPTLFGNSCIIPFADYHDVTKMCWEEFQNKNLIKDFLRDKKWKDFETIEKEVNAFCQKNTFKENGKVQYSYDACDVLKKHLDNLKSSLSKQKNDGKKKPRVKDNRDKKTEQDSTTVIENDDAGDDSSDDKSLKKVVEIIEETTEVTEVITSVKYYRCPRRSQPQIANCSQSLYERSKKTYEKGIGGYLLFQDTPQEKCQDKMDAQDVDLAQLDAFLRGYPLFNKPAKSFYGAGNMCLKKLDDSLNRKQAKLAKTYMMIDFYEKQARLANGTKDIQQGIAEINTLLGQSALSKDNRCNSTIATVDEQCKVFKQCAPQKKKSLFQSKLDASRQAWKELELLQQKKHELHSLSLRRSFSGDYAKRKLQEFNIKGRSGIKRLRGLIQARIDEIKNSYPWLDSSALRNKKSDKITDKMLGKQMTSFYKQQKEKLQKLYNDNVRAYGCLFDEESVNYSKDCGDVDLIIKRNPKLELNGIAKKDAPLQRAFDFYQCAEDQRYLNKHQIEKAADYAIMAGLTFVPFGLGHLGRAAIWGTRLLLAADTAYMANSVKDVVNQCRQNNNKIQKVGDNGRISCQDFVDSAQLLAKQESCLKAGATSASIALIPYIGYGVSRLARTGMKAASRSTIHALPSPTSKALVKRGSQAIRPHVRTRGKVIDVEIVGPVKKLPRGTKLKALPAPKPKMLPAPKSKMLPVPKPKALPAPSTARSISLLSRSEAAKRGTGEFVKLLKKFQISKIKFYRGQITAKNREQLALGILKKFNVSVVKGPKRNQDIYNKLQKLVKDLEKKAATGNRSTRSYYKNLVRHIKKIRYKVSSVRTKPILLPTAKTASSAQNSFHAILKELKINKLVYAKKNLSPKNRTRLINTIIKKEGIVIRGGGHRGRSSKAKLRKIITTFQERQTKASSNAEKAYWGEWLKFVKGI